MVLALVSPVVAEVSCTALLRQAAAAPPWEQGALALSAVFAGEAWEEILAQHMQRYPFDTSAHLVGAWLARREGQPNGRRYLEAGSASFPRGAWLAPVWAQEGP